MKTKDRNTKRDIRKELKSLSKEEHKRQMLAVADVIKGADVVLTTLTGAVSRKLEGTTFDLVIIDEAAQALEIACWIALLKVNRDTDIQNSLPLDVNLPMACGDLSSSSWCWNFLFRI